MYGLHLRGTNMKMRSLELALKDCEFSQEPLLELVLAFL